MIENLTRLKLALQAGVPIPDDLSHWIISALDLFENGKCKTLCAALGLRRTGHDSLATLAARKTRNDWIITIAGTYPGDINEKARKIAARIKSYPNGLDEEERPFYKYLFSLKTKIPLTEKMICNILK